MAEIIIHHYPASPVAEKVRVALGLKKAAWRAVEQNRLPDRPQLFAMTGGYRRIPVMQVGADLYCDTQCILREIERRIPEPTLYPGGQAGLPFGLSRWTDNVMFPFFFRAAFAPNMAALPAALVADRARLYLGPDGDLAKEAQDLPHSLAQMRAMLGWIDESLAHGRLFLLADEPGMADLMAWYLLWFLKARYAGADAFLAEFVRLRDWTERMGAIGYGSPSPMTPDEALSVARDAEPQTPEAHDPLDPQGLKPGMAAAVSPLTDSGEKPVSGVIRASGRDFVALLREAPECGRVCVHFPRVGYRVSPL